MALAGAFGALRSARAAIAVAVFGVVLRLTLKSDPVRGGAIFVGAAVPWAAALVTDAPALCLYGASYGCMVAQGVAHRLSAQESTLEQHQLMRDVSQKVPYEWSHTTFFPALVFHSAHQSLFGSTST